MVTIYHAACYCALHKYSLCCTVYRHSAGSSHIAASISVVIVLTFDSSGSSPPTMLGGDLYREYISRGNHNMKGTEIQLTVECSC